jgi:tetratricopeptide (TPR) repeat protein
MATRHHEPTEAPTGGFEARLQAGFEWLGSRPREVLGTLLLLAVAGAGSALVYEWVTRAEGEAQEALARAERDLAKELGGDRRLILIPEPANPERALAVRLESLAAFEALIDQHSGTRAAEIASLRAAELEIDVDRPDSAEARLGRLGTDLDPDDPVRAMALRLLALVHVEAGRYLEAAESYSAAAEVESYPEPGPMWGSAGRNFERAGALDRAMRAYDRALAADPEWADQNHLVDRIVALEGRMERVSPAPDPIAEPAVVEPPAEPAQTPPAEAAGPPEEATAPEASSSSPAD